MLKKVLVISNTSSNSPAVRYRLLYPLEKLQDESVISYKYLHFYSKRTEKVLNTNNQIKKIIYSLADLICFFFKISTIINSRYDCIIIKNYIFPFGGKLPEKIIQSFFKTSKILYDIDDAIYLNKTRKENLIFSRLRNAYQKIDFWTHVATNIFVSNDIIREDLNNFFKIPGNKCIQFLSCPYENQYFQKCTEISLFKKNNETIFIWLGSPHTQNNLQIFANFIVDLPKYIKNAKVIIIGATAGFSLFKNLKHVSYEEWSEQNELKYMRLAKFGLNPLSNNIFEKKKSAFKVIQYYRAGIIPIVSDVGINKDLITKYGGYCLNSEKNNSEVYDFILNSLQNYDQISMDIYESTKMLSVEQNKVVIKNVLS